MPFAIMPHQMEMIGVATQVKPYIRSCLIIRLSSVVCCMIAISCSGLELKTVNTTAKMNKIANWEAVMAGFEPFDPRKLGGSLKALLVLRGYQCYNAI